MGKGYLSYSSGSSPDCVLQHTWYFRLLPSWLWDRCLRTVPKPSGRKCEDGDNHSDKDRGDDSAGNGRGGNASSCGDGLRFECYSEEQGSGTGVSMHTG